MWKTPNIKAQQIIDSIKDVYLHQDNYVMTKHVQDFFHGDKFIGDFFNYTIFELLENLPPRIYITAGPYDTVSNKAPEQALVYHNGQLELNIDYTDYVSMRTGVMDSFLFKSLGVKSMKDKGVIIFGTGKIARWSLQYLKETYPDLEEIDIVNASGNVEAFVQFAKDIGVSAIYQKNPALGKYDFIILHTSAESAVLSAEDVSRIKFGAVITSYRTSSQQGELAIEFFDTESNQVIVDWEDSLSVLELRKARGKGLLREENVLTLTNLLQRNTQLENKRFTVFRSMGTPMQDVAMLQLIMQEEK